MTQLTHISPESFDVANAYLQYGSVEEVSRMTHIPLHVVSEQLAKPETKRYLDAAYLDMGYRNRNKLGALLDKMIDAKIAEAEETGEYTKKDLLELITLAHKMRMDEIKADKTEGNTTTVNVAQFGEGHYGALMTKLLGDKK